MRSTTEPADFDAQAKAAKVAAIARKDREHHRQVAGCYDRAITDRYAIYHRWDLHPWVAAVAKRHPNGTALDLGTGTGVVASALAAHGFRVSAVDHSRDMLDVARRKSRDQCWAARLAQADVTHLPFGDGSFDVVTMQGILHHVPLTIEEVVTEAARVLRRGGDFYISEPCADLSPVGRVLRSPLWFRPYDPAGEETDEEAIPWGRLARTLDAAGLTYRVRFLTHIPSAHFHFWLPDGLRLGITRLVSAPFARGDLLFVHGSK